MTFRLLPAAETDLAEISGHIADDDPAAALRWFESILRRCRQLGETPGMGVARPDVRPELRLFPFGKYLILYREVDGGAEIVRVIHGARQWRELF